MTEWGIPERPSTLRARDMVDMFAITPLRTATEHLRRGKKIAPVDDYDMMRLANQCRAFIAAYEAAKGMDDVLEDER